MRNQILIGVLATILIIIVVIASYMLGRQNAQENPSAQTQNEIVETPVPTASLSIYPTISPTTSAGNTQAYVKEQIKAAITSKNTGALEGYMASTASVRIENSSCCGMLSSLEAAKQLDYLNQATGPWNFSDLDPNIVALRAASQYYASPAVVGVSPDKYAVSFQFDSQNKINAISLSADYSLLLSP